jgi:hypothetical protein
MRTRQPELLVPKDNAWYVVQLNTATLVQEVFQTFETSKLSAGHIWNLCRLTWLTDVEDHWRRIKVPALASLFQKSEPDCEVLRDAIAAMHLPSQVARASGQTTGIVNFYTAYRNSSLDWCNENVKTLRQLLGDSAHLDRDDIDRIELASRISALPRIPSPSGAKSINAAFMLTPVVACLDPARRFPIINGGVVELVKLLSAGPKLEDRVVSLIQLAQQLGADSFRLDATVIQDETFTDKVESWQRCYGPTLPQLDDTDHRGLRVLGDITYTRRHAKMTNQLRRLFRGLKQGGSGSRYDVIIPNYDRHGRDLLIEAKPDPAPDAIRTAIGQLFDYRRSVPKRNLTDLAVLTIDRPSDDYIALLNELEIDAVWFTDEECTALDAHGPSRARIMNSAQKE